MHACLLQALMSEPVIAADGYTYEAKARQEWRQQHETSPVTGMLVHTLTIPNIVIKQLIKQSHHHK